MSKKSGIQLKTNKVLQKLWHPDSGFVFRSKDDKTVIGQCVDDKLVPLSEEMVDACKKLKFSFDKSLLKKEEEKLEKEDDEDEEEENEEEENEEENEEEDVEKEEIEVVKQEVKKRDVEKPVKVDQKTSPSLSKDPIIALMNQLQEEYTKVVARMRESNNELLTENERLKSENVETKAKMAKISALFSS